MNATGDKTEGSIENTVIVVCPPDKSKLLCSVPDALFRAVVENSGEGITIVDTQENIVYANAAAEAIFGVSPGELAGRNLRAFTDETAFTIILEQTRLRKLGTSSNYDHPIIRPDGERRILSISATPQRDAAGAVTSTFSLFSDVTDRRAAEQMLSKSEERFRGLFESLPVSVWEADFSSILSFVEQLQDSGVEDLDAYLASNPEAMDECVNRLIVKDVNRKTLELYNAPDKSAFTSNVRDLFPPHKRDILRQQIVAFIREQRSFECEIMNEDLEGNPRFLSLVAAVAPGFEKTLDRVMVSLMDITASRRAERARSAVYQISEAAQRVENLDDLYVSIHASVKDLLKVDNLYIALYEPSTDTVSFPYWVDEMDPPPPPQPLGRGVTDYVIRTGRSLTVSPETIKPLVECGEVVIHGSLSQSWIGVPLKTERGILGALVIQSYSGGYSFVEEKRDILTFVSGQVAMAIERKRNHLVQSSTYRIAEAALLSPTLEEFYPAVHAIVRELMPAENFFVALYDDQKDWISFPYFVDETGDWPQGRRPGRGLTEYVLRQGKPVLINPSDFARLQASGEAELIGSDSVDWIGAPLHTEHGIIGILATQTYHPDKHLTESDCNVLAFVSGQVAMAIERKRMEQDLLESEARYRKLAEENADLLIRFQHEAEVKSMLLQEVNHRVKNNLASILGMLDMEMNEPHDESGHAPKAIGELRNRIYALSSIHEILSASGWSPLRLDHLVTDLIKGNLRGSHAAQQVQVDVSAPDEPVWVMPKLATSLALIITELTTNSIKHAFSHQGLGHIQATIRCLGDAWNRVSLDFQDNGPGFPKAILSGWRPSIGLKLIGLNVKNLLKGEVIMENSPGARTLITFQPMPIAPVKREPQP